MAQATLLFIVLVWTLILNGCNGFCIDGKPCPFVGDIYGAFDKHKDPPINYHIESEVLVVAGIAALALILYNIYLFCKCSYKQQQDYPIWDQ